MVRSSFRVVVLYLVSVLIVFFLFSLTDLNPFVETFSAMGIQPGLYVPTLVFGLFVSSLLSFLVEHDIRVVRPPHARRLTWLTRASFASVTLALAIPHVQGVPLLRWGHTIFALLYAVLMIILMILVDRDVGVVSFFRFLPFVALFGSLALFSAIGLSMMVELFIFTIFCVWLYDMRIVVERRLKKNLHI